MTPTEKKLKNFSDLLDSLSKSEDKKKLLWKEAYQNAIEDRENTSILVSDILLQIRGNMANHQTYGVIITKYLERMAKSNDQILKLAEIISKEQEKENVIMPNDIFDQIDK
jgi:hypothetical protein